MSAALRRIRAVNYRCLRDVDLELDEFHVLVGANGSGKSTLFDALLFVRDSLLLGLDTAAERRTGDFRDLVWGRPDRDLAFELAFELDVPNAIRDRIPKSYHRFAISLSVSEVECGNLSGTLVACLKPSSDEGEGPPTSGAFTPPPSSSQGMAFISTGKSPTGNAFTPGLWKTEMKFDSGTPLGPEIGFEHPLVTRVVTDTFSQVSDLFLENRLLRQASKAPKFGRPTANAGLPWLVLRLRRYPDRYDAWLRHIRTAVADLRDVDVRTRADDRHSYLVVTYEAGLEVPSWALSDGTLRLLALSIIAYLPEEGRMYLIEEPENCVHPLAVEAIYRSLSSAYDAQVLVTTHSPVLLACTEPKELLCFSKQDGETQVIRGDEHPHLRHWQSAADVDLLFAPEVLG